MSPRWVRRALVVLALLGVAVVLKLTLLRPKAVPVTVFRAAKGQVEETVTNSRAGTVKARRRATLSPEVGGRVARLVVREGARVKAGDVLMEIASADHRAELSLQERSLAVARASEREASFAAEQAQRDLARSTSLARDEILAQGVLEQAQSQRDRTRAASEASRSRVLQAEAAVEMARVTLAKTVLKAPFDGVVARISTEEGEWITPSPPGLPIPPVLELFDPDALYVSAPLDEVDVGKVRAGAPVRITIDAFPGLAIPGRVSRVSPYVLDVREQNRTFDVEAEFADPQLAQKLLPGTSADIVVVLDTRKDVLRIPSYALLEGGKVLVVRDDALQAVKVQTGLKNWEWVEINGGLAAGDPVVVSLDRAEVKAGARARIEAETER